MVTASPASTSSENTQKERGCEFGIFLIWSGNRSFNHACNHPFHKSKVRKLLATKRCQSRQSRILSRRKQQQAMEVEVKKLSILSFCLIGLAFGILLAGWVAPALVTTTENTDRKIIRGSIVAIGFCLVAISINTRKED